MRLRRNVEVRLYVYMIQLIPNWLMHSSQSPLQSRAISLHQIQKCQNHLPRLMNGSDFILENKIPGLEKKYKKHKNCQHLDPNIFHKILARKHITLTDFTTLGH